MVMNRCSCGSKYFEDIDVTPVGITKKRYFTRCKICGLIVAVHGGGPKKKYYAMLLRLPFVKKKVLW